MQYSLFPDMTNEELKNQLLKKDFGVVRYEKNTGTADSGVPFGVTVTVNEKMNFTENEVGLIVQKIGSHMENLIQVLRGHFEQKQPINGKLKLVPPFLSNLLFEKLLLTKLWDNVLKKSMIFLETLKI